MKVCRIYRDYNTDEVTKVVNPQGEDSKLYNDALKALGDTEEALNVWAYAYTPSFRSKFGEWVEEPTLQTVMDDLYKSKEEVPLSVGELADVMSTVKEGSLSSLYKQLKSIFFNKDGKFVINKKLLEKSGIYNSNEISNILSFPTLRANIISGLSKIRNTLMDTDYDSNETRSPIVIKTSDTNILGQYIEIPQEEVDDTIVREVGQYVSEDEFLTKLNGISDENVRDAVLQSPETIAYARDLSKKFKVVEVHEFQDGELVPKSQDNLYSTLRNTVTIAEDKLDFTKTIDALRSIEDWNEDSGIVQKLLKEVEHSAARAGIDLVGLEGVAFNKSVEEVLGFLDYVDDFNVLTETGEVNDQSISELASEISDFFGKQETPTYEVVPINKSPREEIMIDNPLSDSEMFDRGYLRTQGNLFIKVNRESLSGTIEDIYNALQNNPTFMDVGLSDKVIRNPEEKAKVLAAIDRIALDDVREMTTENADEFNNLKEIALLKNLLNIKPDAKQAVEVNLAGREQSITADVDYLTSDFISDFYKDVLTEKADNSEVYNRALKYFSFSNGIELNAPESRLNEVMTILQDNHNYPMLQQYALLSKSETMEPFIVVDESFNDVDSRRDYVVNYPDSIRKFQGDFTRVSKDTIVTKNTTDEFIRLNDGLYELVMFNDGLGQYSRIDEVKDSNYYVFNMSKPAIEDVNLESYRDLSPDTSPEGFSKTRLQDSITCQV